jgi:hypothetical protein
MNKMEMKAKGLENIGKFNNVKMELGEMLLGGIN